MFLWKLMVIQLPCDEYMILFIHVHAISKKWDFLFHVILSELLYQCASKIHVYNYVSSLASALIPNWCLPPPPQIVTQTNSTCLWCNNLGLTQSSCIPELFYPHNLWQTWGGKHNSKVVHNVSRCALEANLICTVHVHVWLQFSNVCSSCKKKNLFILWVGAR